jgi:pimeloyl-ACP methyl ester carboxylesterase
MPITGPSVEKRFVASPDGVRLDYAVLGSGEPVVMLHGLLAGRASFARQHELADRWKLILPSTRGHDDSNGQLPLGYGIHTTELEDLWVVLEAEGIDNFDVVGHSSGGALAFALAQRHPSRVRRMVLIEPTLIGILQAADRNEITGAFKGFADASREVGPMAGLERALQWLGGQSWMALDAAKREHRLRAMSPMAHLIGPHSLALIDFPVTPDDLKSVTTPTLLIYGEDSFPIEARLAERLRELRPDWQQVLVPEAGHNCFRERPELVNDAIRAFLSSPIGGA